jgi:hypothetical protein
MPKLLPVPFGDSVPRKLEPMELEMISEMAKKAKMPRMKLLGQGNLGLNIADEVAPDATIVFLKFTPSNVYLEKAADGGMMLPKCWSWNGIAPDANSNQVMSPTCKDCKWNEFGSAEKGRGKRCTNTFRTFVLLPGTRIPIMFSIPTTSMGAFQELLGKMMFHDIMLNRAVVKVTTERVTKNTFPVTLAKFTIVGRLDDEAAKVVEELSAAVLPLFMANAQGEVLANEATETVRENIPDGVEDDALPQ